MPSPTPAQLHRQHFTNALFARVTGHDLYLAQQIKDGIAFSRLAPLALTAWTEKQPRL